MDIKTIWKFLGSIGEVEIGGVKDGKVIVVKKGGNEEYYINRALSRLSELITTVSEWSGYYSGREREILKEIIEQLRDIRGYIRMKDYGRAERALEEVSGMALDLENESRGRVIRWGCKEVMEYINEAMYEEGIKKGREFRVEELDKLKRLVRNLRYNLTVWSMEVMQRDELRNIEHLLERVKVMDEKLEQAYQSRSRQRRKEELEGLRREIARFPSIATGISGWRRKELMKLSLETLEEVERVLNLL